MKYINIIRVLSVLLCIVALLVACDSSKKDDTTEAGTEAPTEAYVKDGIHEPVEPELENFFEFGNTGKELHGEAVRIEGECVDRTENYEVIVLRDAKVDYKNVVTETFTVYNTVLQKTVLTVTNTYDYGHYADFDWDDLGVTDEDIKYPSSVMSVSVDTPYSYFVGGAPNYITVKKANVSLIDEEIREENPDGNIYEIEISCEFYDIEGTKITDTGYIPDVYAEYYNTSRVSIGDAVATFDEDTGKLISVTHPDTDKHFESYDEENQKYGYFFDSQYGAFTDIDFFEVYDKYSGECVLRYYPEYADVINAYVLRSGDILVQALNEVEQDGNYSYDLTVDGANYNISTYIVNIDTGAKTTVECDFYIAYLTKNDEWSVGDSLEDSGITLTENVVNFALICKIEDRQLGDAEFAVLNNDGSVMFELERVIPEHNLAINLFGISAVGDGYYLVNLHNVAAPYAIIDKSGDVISYLSKEYSVAGNLLADENGIYSFDMSEVFSFEGDESVDYSLVCAAGNYIVLEKTTTVTETDENGEIENVTVESEQIIYRVDGESMTETEILDEDSVVLADRSTKNYLMTLNQNTGKYTLYSADLEHVLTTANEMQIRYCDGKYIICTTLLADGEYIDIFYTVNAPESDAE